MRRLLTSDWNKLPILVVIAVLAGCDREGIRTYDAPADPPPLTLDSSEGQGAGPFAQTPRGATWTMPESWRPDPQPPAMAAASFLLGNATINPPARVTVTQLAGDGGGLLANVNRWRSQLQLPPVASIDEQATRPVSVAGAVEPGVAVDLQADAAYGSDPQRTLGVLIFRPTDAWFVKATGPASVLEAARTDFDAFVASLQLPPASP